MSHNWLLINIGLCLIIYIAFTIDERHIRGTRITSTMSLVYFIPIATHLTHPLSHLKPIFNFKLCHMIIFYLIFVLLCVFLLEQTNVTLDKRGSHRPPHCYILYLLPPTSPTHLATWSRFLTFNYVTWSVFLII